MYKDRRRVFNYYFTNDISVTVQCGQFGSPRVWFHNWLRQHKLFGEVSWLDIVLGMPAIHGIVLDRSGLASILQSYGSRCL